jgi:hypothetical protein
MPPVIVHAYVLPAVLVTLYDIPVSVAQTLMSPVIAEVVGFAFLVTAWFMGVPTHPAAFVSIT